MVKIRNSVPKGDKTLDIDASHKIVATPMKEPKNFVNALLPIYYFPFMIINALISIGMINIFSDISLREFGLTDGGGIHNHRLSIPTFHYFSCNPSRVNSFNLYP